MSEFEALKTALSATGIPFAEHAWVNAPASGSYGVYALEFDADTVWGDSHLGERAMQGSVDLFVRGGGTTDRALVESAFESAGVSWRLNSTQLETARRIVHYEWVFEVIT